jgi:hypothetical protein
MKPVLFSLLALVLSVVAGVASQQPAISPNHEYVILSGGPSLLLWEKWKNPPHDKWWLNFIRAAEIRIRQLENEGVAPGQITWMVYRPSYETRSKQEGQNCTAAISALSQSLGCKLKFFSNTREVIAHLNAGKPRESVKIADFEYFGHSNKACWLFDYSNQIDSASKVWLHEDELGQINPGIFAKNAYVKSWGCHTGESMSRKFRSASGLKMWGATGRTQYMTEELPVLASPGASKWKY